MMMAGRKDTSIDLWNNAICIRHMNRLQDREIDECIEQEMTYVAQQPDTLFIRDRDTGSITLLHIPWHVRVKNFYAQMFGDNEEVDRIRDALQEAIVLRNTDAT